MNRLESYSVLDSFMDAAMVIGTNGEFIHGNEALSNLCGIPLRQILKKKKVDEIFSVSPNNVFDSKSLSQLESSTPYVEVNFTSTSGKLGKVQISMQAIEDGNGQKRILVYMRDVSLEEKLHSKYRSELLQKDAKIAEISLLLEISNVLTGISDTNTVYENVADKLLTHNICDIICHLQVQDGTGPAQIRVFRPKTESTIMEVPKANLDPFKFIWSKNEFKIVTKNEQKDFFSLFAARMEMAGQTHMAILPIQTTRFRGGYFLLFKSSPISMENAESLHLLKSVTSQTGVALESAQFFEHSITDEMTKFFNKRFLLSRLNGEIERATRTNSTLSFIIFDIDKFKTINDIYGHQVGDHVLKEVAHAVKSLCRAYDIAARFGGDEFVIILPNTNAQGASLLTERIRKKIEAMEIKVKSETIQVTISLGIACFPDHAQDMNTLMVQADKALYFSKKSGRNQTKVYGVDCETILAVAKI